MLGAGVGAIERFPRRAAMVSGLGIWFPMVWMTVFAGAAGPETVLPSLGGEVRVVPSMLLLERESVIVSYCMYPQ